MTSSSSSCRRSVKVKWLMSVILVLIFMLGLSLTMTVKADMATTAAAVGETAQKHANSIKEQVKEQAQHVVEHIPVIGSLLGKDKETQEQQQQEQLLQQQQEARHVEAELTKLQHELKENRQKLDEQQAHQQHDTLSSLLSSKSSAPSSTSSSVLPSWSLSRLVRRWTGGAGGATAAEDSEFSFLIDHFGNEIERIHQRLNSQNDMILQKFEHMNQLQDKANQLLHDTLSAANSISSRELTNSQIVNNLQTNDRRLQATIDRVHELLRESHVPPSRLQAILTRLSEIPGAAKDRVSDFSDLAALKAESIKSAFSPSPPTTLDRAKEMMGMASHKTGEAAYAAKETAQQSLEKMMHELQQLNLKLMDEVRSIRKGGLSQSVSGLGQSVSSTVDQIKETADAYLQHSTEHSTLWNVITAPYHWILSTLRYAFDESQNPVMAKFSSSVHDFWQRHATLRNVLDITLVLTSIAVAIALQLAVVYATWCLLRWLAVRMGITQENVEDTAQQLSQKSRQLRRDANKQVQERIPQMQVQAGGKIRDIEHKASHFVTETVPQQFSRATHALHLDEMGEQLSAEAHQVREKGLWNRVKYGLRKFVNIIIGAYRGAKGAFNDATSSKKSSRQGQVRETFGQSQQPQLRRQSQVEIEDVEDEDQPQRQQQSQRLQREQQHLHEQRASDERVQQAAEQQTKGAIREGIDKVKQGTQQAGSHVGGMVHQGQEKASEIASAASVLPSKVMSSLASSGIGTSSEVPPKTGSGSTGGQREQKEQENSAEIAGLLSDHPSNREEEIRTTNDPANGQPQQQERLSIAHHSTVPASHAQIKETKPIQKFEMDLHSQEKDKAAMDLLSQEKEKGTGIMPTPTLEKAYAPVSDVSEKQGGVGGVGGVGGKAATTTPTTASFTKVGQGVPTPPQQTIPIIQPQPRR